MLAVMSDFGIAESKSESKLLKLLGLLIFTLHVNYLQIVLMGGIAEAGSDSAKFRKFIYLSLERANISSSSL